MRPPKIIEATPSSLTGTPWDYSQTLVGVHWRIIRASHRGRGLRLTAEDVRALDWAVIRESGGLDTSRWRETTPAYLDRAA